MFVALAHKIKGLASPYNYKKETSTLPLSKGLIRRIGLDAALFLTALLEKANCTDKPVTMTEPETTEIIQLSPYKRKAVIKKLKNLGIIHSTRTGLPYRQYFKVNCEHPTIIALNTD